MKYILISFLFIYHNSLFSENYVKEDNEISQNIETQLKKKKETEKLLNEKIQLIKKQKQKDEAKRKNEEKKYLSNYKRFSVNNNIFWPSPKWITDDKTITFTLDIKTIVPDISGNFIDISILDMSIKESYTVKLKKIDSTLYRGIFDFSKSSNEEYYVFYSFKKRGVERTIYFKLTNSKALYENDLLEVKSAKEMLSVILALRKKMDEKMHSDEKSRIKKEIDDLQQAKEEIEHLEKNLKAEKELLYKRRLEEERINKIKEAELKRQLYEQRLAEERRLRLQQEKARIIKEREAQLLEMQRKKAQNIIESKKLVSIGQEALINGEYENAITIFNRAKNLNPLNTDADFYIGVSLFYLDQRKEALNILRKIEEENPTYIEVHYYLASLYFKDQKYGASIVKFNQSISYGVKTYDSKFFLGVSYYKMEDHDNAQKYFKELASIEGPKKELSYLFEGLCYFKNKQYESSIKVFEKLYYEGEDENVAKQAQQFLSKARAMKRFEDRKLKNFEADIALGTSYNSNVTNASDSQISPSDKSSMGYSAKLALSYLPYYNETWDSSLSFNFDELMYTKMALSSFESRALGFSTMIKYKSMFTTTPQNDKQEGKQYIYSLSLNVNYSHLYMDYDRSGKKNIYSKIKSISPSLMVILSDLQISTLTVPLIMDDNFYDDNNDTVSYGLAYTHLYFLTKSKKEYLSGTLGIIFNSAQGNNESYNQYKLQTSYTRPAIEKITTTGGLSIQLDNYNSHDEGRSDKKLSLTLNFDRSFIPDALSSRLYFNYDKNMSTIDISSYSAWALGLVINGTY